MISRLRQPEIWWKIILVGLIGLTVSVGFADADIGSAVPSSPSLLEIAQGKVTGHSTVNKFGRNIEIDNNVTADVWDGGHTLTSGGVSLIWVAPTQARIHQIASSSNNDSDSGGDNPQSDGARTIQVAGLINWDTAEITESITLDGTTVVSTTNSYVIIHRAFVLTKGGNASGPNVGPITMTAATDGTVTALIRAGQGETQMSIYGVPSTQVLYVGRFYGNVNKSGGAAGLIDASLRVNPNPDVELINFLVKHTFGLQTVGTSALTINYYVPKKFEGPAIVKIQVDSGTNDMDVSAGIDAVLANN